MRGVGSCCWLLAAAAQGWESQPTFSKLSLTSMPASFFSQRRRSSVILPVCLKLASRCLWIH